MKKLSLFLLVSVFAFCGCSDDDDAKTYVLSLPNLAAAYACLQIKLDG